MRRFLKVLSIAVFLGSTSGMVARAQDAVTPFEIQQRDPDVCGAAGAGCDPAEVRHWKAVGNRLADLSSADLSQYAYACVQHTEWKQECVTDPTAVLRRLGIEGY